MNRTDLPSIEEILKMVEESLERDSIKTPEEKERLDKAYAEVYKTSIARLPKLTKLEYELENGYESEDEESKSEPLAAIDDMEILELNLKKWNEFANKPDEKQSPPEYRCVYCNFMYPSEKILKDHNKKRCVNEYRCRLCCTVFARKEHYDYHINRKKSCAMLSDHKCKYCNKAYSTDWNMREHTKICKSKKEINTKVQKNKEIKVSEIEKHIKEYNNQDNKNLLNFDISESTIKNLREKFSIPDLDKIAKYLESEDYNNLVEFAIKRIHYSDNNKKCQNIKYIDKLDKYIIYDEQWKYKSEENVLSILHKEVEFVIYMAMNASDVPSNKKLMKVLEENKKSLNENNFKKIQVDSVKHVQKKYDESKK